MLVRFDAVTVAVDAAEPDLREHLGWMVSGGQSAAGTGIYIEIGREPIPHPPGLTNADVYATKYTTFMATPDRRYCLAVTPGVGECLIDFERARISCQQILSVRHAPRTVVRCLFLDPLWFLLPRFGATITHAALLRASCGCTTLVMGSSGAGKTTVCLRASSGNHAPFRVLADDTCILTLRDSGLVAEPVRTGFGIAQGSPFALSIQGWEPWFRRADKQYFKSVPGEGRGGGPLTSVVLLMSGTGCGDASAEICALDRGASLKAMLDGQTTVPSPLLSQHYAIWRSVATRCRVFATYGRTWTDTLELQRSFAECLGHDCPRSIARSRMGKVPT